MSEASDFIARVAQVSASVGEQAGVGGMETAGSILSFLADYPDWIGAFMKDGYFGLPRNFDQMGSLTWHGADGKVYSPEYARHHRIVRSLAKAPAKSEEGQ